MGSHADSDLDAGMREHMEARVGQTLCNKYTLEKLIGIGGMAAVYRGSHRNGNRVAVKVLHTELYMSKDIRERFLREGYVANRVDHPGAVRVLDDDVAEDGSVFLVMELLEGETLETHVARSGGKLGPRELVPFACQLLDVLAAAHEKGIVHRDIKPENLFVSRDRSLKVLDFGIARLNDSARQATRTGRLLGTPVYMAPEQARGATKLIDGQTDIWAAGAVMFRVLSGRYVHDGETPEMVMIHSATKDPPRLRDVMPSVNPQVAEIVDRALVVEKAGRWKSAQAMATALRGLRAEELADVPSPLEHAVLAATLPIRGDATAPVLHDAADDDDGIGFTEPNITMAASNPVERAAVKSERWETSLRVDAVTEADVPETRSPLLGVPGPLTTEGIATTRLETSQRPGGSATRVLYATAALVAVGLVGGAAVALPPGALRAPAGAGLTATSSPAIPSVGPWPASASAAPVASGMASAAAAAAAPNALPAAGSPSGVATSMSVSDLPNIPRTAPRTGGGAPPSGRAAGTASCDPPFTTSPAGTRVWKIECFRK